MPDPYHVGTGVTMRTTFTDPNGVKGDPTEVTLKVRKPNGTVLTYTYSTAQITRESEGIFSKKVVVDLAGRWHFSYDGDGTVEASDKESFLVLPLTP